MRIYDAAKDVPEKYLKPITGGKLNGMSNINAQWRIKKLTELFGPVGFGWTTRNTQFSTEVVDVMDPKTGSVFRETVVKCTLELLVNLDGQWSQPIIGVGGSKIAGKGQGLEANDEAWKSSETDALSVACKKLGIAGTIYEGMDDTKYSDGGTFGGPTPADPLKAALADLGKAKSKQDVLGIWQRNPNLWNNDSFKQAVASNDYYTGVKK